MNAIGQQRPNGHRPRHALRLARSDEVIGDRIVTLFAAAHESGWVQVFGRRYDEPVHAL
jgi:hypothetical protein